MPVVLTTNAVITCPHGFPGITTPLWPFWTVDGGFVTAEGDPGVLSCVFIPPCVGYTLKSMNLNATQRNGQQVILVTDFQQSITGLPLTITEVNTCQDESTPAPLPSGQGVPPASPAMADLIPPVVTASPMSGTFSASAPAPVPFVFSLTTDHPLKWILTLISQSSGVSIDLTSGKPGAVVAPSGGTWSSPSLTVSVTLSPLFIAPLGTPAQPAQLYLTGVSQRGSSGHVVATINYTP